MSPNNGPPRSFAEFQNSGLMKVSPPRQPKPPEYYKGSNSEKCLCSACGRSIKVKNSLLKDEKYFCKKCNKDLEET